MTQRRSRNGQYAPNLFGRTAPTPNISMPGRVTSDQVSAQAVAFVAGQLGVAESSVVYDAKTGYVTVGSQQLRIHKYKMVPTDYGRAFHGATPRTVFTLRRRGIFKRDLTEQQIADMRAELNSTGA